MSAIGSRCIVEIGIAGLIADLPRLVFRPPKSRGKFLNRTIDTTCLLGAIIRARQSFLVPWMEEQEQPDSRLRG